jgi:O-acetyl-ADP-ribose deacetylase (regulator of RNase III)
MVTYVKGNIFESPAQVITNTVNTVGVMGKGLALEFKNRFPLMFEDYQEPCKKGTVQPGTPYLWENDEVQILNFPTKREWQSHSLIEDIETGIKYLASHYAEWGIHTLALPPLGCGLGGLKWENVRPLIEKYLGEITDLEVFVYEPTAAGVEVKVPRIEKESQPGEKQKIAAQSPNMR